MADREWPGASTPSGFLPPADFPLFGVGVRGGSERDLAVAGLGAASYDFQRFTRYGISGWPPGVGELSLWLGRSAGRPGRRGRCRAAGRCRGAR